MDDKPQKPGNMDAFINSRRENRVFGNPDNVTQFPRDPAVNPAIVDARSWSGKPRPVRQFLDGRNWFRMGMVSNLSGPGAIGKTLVTLQACVAIASETLWLNHKIRSGPVIFLSAEEPIEELHIRIDEICEAENLRLEEFPHPLEIIDASQEEMAALIEASHDRSGKLAMRLTALYRWLDQHCAATCPVALFIDNRAQVIIGNENDRNVAGFSMRMLGALARRHGMAVIILSHPSNSGTRTGASGSTQWFNTARSNVYMRRPDHDFDEDDLKDDDGRRELTNNKSNYAPQDSKANVKWEFYRYICTDPITRPGEKIGIADKAERVFIKLLHWHIANGISVSASKGNTYAPTIFACHDDREGLTPKLFRTAMLSLLNRKIIANVAFGPPSRTRHRLDFCNP